MDHLEIASAMVEKAATSRAAFEQQLAHMREIRVAMETTMAETIEALKRNEEIYDPGLLQILETVRLHMLDEVDVDIDYYQRKIAMVDTTVPMLRATVQAFKDKRAGLT